MDYIGRIRQMYKDVFDSVEKVFDYMFPTMEFAYEGLRLNNYRKSLDFELLPQVLNTVKRRELREFIEQNGGELIRSGSHDVIRVNGKTSIISHGSGGEDVPNGTLSATVRQLGLKARFKEWLERGKKNK